MAGKPRDASTKEIDGEKNTSTNDADIRTNVDTEHRKITEGRKKTSQVEHLTVKKILIKIDSLVEKTSDRSMFGRQIL